MGCISESSAFLLFVTDNADITFGYAGIFANGHSKCGGFTSCQAFASHSICRVGINNGAGTGLEGTLNCNEFVCTGSGVFDAAGNDGVRGIMCNLDVGELQVAIYRRAGGTGTGGTGAGTGQELVVIAVVGIIGFSTATQITFVCVTIIRAGNAGIITTTVITVCGIVNRGDGDDCH